MSYPSPVKVDKDRQMVVLEDEFQVSAGVLGARNTGRALGTKLVGCSQAWNRYLINRAQ